MGVPMTVHPQHVGYHAVNPFIVSDDPEALIAFLTRVFAGVETERITRPDGSIGHSEVRVDDSIIMVSSGSESYPPQPSSHYVYVPDVDATYARALAAGATSLGEPSDKFYGNREAGVRDPLNNVWWIATLKEVVPADELQSRFDASRES